MIAIDKKVEKILKKIYEAGFEVAIVGGAVRDLIQRSTLISERVSKGNLQVRSALYHLDTGMVDFD